ncbi:MAG TPA: phosphohydrolase [Cyanobacteria bacterium UBA11149]|nr:phosphohydrolase [Cyanobacteria bacterium UBA11367]HBE59457.1 phosphohydrolase [Cyanobacteria bacterium UBA11366]HBK65442.1 phosphohydrolase [Cyanobacteria bacterium UBA11166]HBR77201.1 phosphohydrolase [Cyanobacteria bacterium UBA11159]HBS72601.1 phosphohydrolase [Cyanobacteria bacterium UBA11153]HBW88656.1 phosphohydrolase [Cyanobacteria bacterium UBA11149]HCA96113.1 phosphohydrolase [Cyanobacteria bacterium UBA9226]
MALNTETPILTTRFEQALVLAHQLHHTQIRKGSGIPYISHLLSVAALVLEDGGDEDEAIAALLHDAVEDAGGAATREIILQQFGERVTSIIDGCTECDIQPKPPWRDRKLLYLDKIRHASPSVLRVSMADKLHNIRSILADWEREGDEVWLKFKGGKEGSLWFYSCLLEIYREGCDGFLVGELARIINKLDDNLAWGSISF